MVKRRKTSVSDCHYTTYQTKSNGLWNYHVCDKCGDKTEPIKVWNRLVNTIEMKENEIEELVKSDNNGKDWFDSYQEVDNFLFNELEKLNIEFPIIKYNMKPELNTIEAIKLLTEALVEKKKDGGH